MYAVPLIVLLVVVFALGAWVSPIFALVIAIPAALLFLAYFGLSRRRDGEIPPPTGGVRLDPEDNKHGIWGER